MRHRNPIFLEDKTFVLDFVLYSGFLPLFSLTMKTLLVFHLNVHLTFCVFVCLERKSTPKLQSYSSQCLIQQLKKVPRSTLRTFAPECQYPLHRYVWGPKGFQPASKIVVSSTCLTDFRPRFQSKLQKITIRDEKNQSPFLQ